MNAFSANEANVGQIVEKPRGDLEKVLPREDLKPRDVPKAFGISRGIQILPRGNFFQTLIFYQCNLRFRVYRSHCGFTEIFP